MAGEDKKLVWLEAMQNVAAAHHAIIVAEYNRLMRERGLDIGAPPNQIATYIRDWLLLDKRAQLMQPMPNQSGYSNAPIPRRYTTKVIQCIKEVRSQFGLGLKEAKDAVDAVRNQMEATGEL